MNLIKTSALFVLLSFLLASCGPTLKPFTKNMYEDFGWSERDLQNVQFYLSHDIVLERKGQVNDSSIKDGKIRVKEGKRIERIRIKRGTPGTLVFIPKKNRFAVSFDEDEKKFLMFGPSKKVNGRFVLFAQDWNRHKGEITYNNETYYTTSASAMAHLLVDIKAASKVKYHKEEASGRVID